MIAGTDEGHVREQLPVDATPFDTWRDPDGGTVAEFYRTPRGYLLRFPERADFEIDARTFDVRTFPASEDMFETADALLHNAVSPLLGNHAGGLHLHGSAVVIDGRGFAFLGLSRRGKTTLAAAFAHAGHPFLTEDVVRLEKRVGHDGTDYLVHPSRPVLRLFADSASHLLDSSLADDDEGGKQSFDAHDRLPFADSPVPLSGLMLLGAGEHADIALQAITAQEALPEIMQQAFILDVDDKPRLRGHFQRLGDVALAVPCYMLDFPRDFEALPAVIERVVSAARHSGTENATG